MHHPEHDRLAAEVRSWYRVSASAIGYQIERRRFGFYRRNAANPDSARIIVDRLAARDVTAMIADARQYFGDGDIDIWIDDHDSDATLGPSLLAAGCSRADATIYLAHVGAIPQTPPNPDVRIEAVTSKTLRDFAIVKLKGFANTEDEQLPQRVAQEIALREAEMRGPGRFFIARIDGEAAAILGYFEGTDRLIFNLATRLPFRDQGLARVLLCGAFRDAQKMNCRSVIINTNPDDTPIQWYRRLGFTDEVYWRRSYIYESRHAQHTHLERRSQ